MTFFDEISKNLTGYGKEAARKAKDAAQVLQLKAQIRGEKQKINELYAAIGAVYFKNHRDDSEDEYKIFFPEIESAMVHVAELEKKLSQLDTTEKCPCCGAAVKKGDSFCSKCGTPIQKEEDGTEEQHIAVTEDDLSREQQRACKRDHRGKKTEAAEIVVQETETENTTEEETEQKEEPVSEPEE